MPRNVGVCSHIRCRRRENTVGCLRKPNTILDINPRIIRMTHHWRGYFIPAGMRSSKRYARLFDESIRTQIRFQANDTIQHFISTKPRSIPDELFGEFLRLAKFKECIILVNNIDVTKNGLPL